MLTPDILYIIESYMTLVFHSLSIILLTFTVVTYTLFTELRSAISMLTLIMEWNRDGNVQKNKALVKEWKKNNFHNKHALFYAYWFMILEIFQDVTYYFWHFQHWFHRYCFCAKNFREKLLKCRFYVFFLNKVKKLYLKNRIKCCKN